MDSLFGRYQLTFHSVHYTNCNGLVDDNKIVPTTVCTMYMLLKKANLRLCT